MQRAARRAFHISGSSSTAGDPMPGPREALRHQNFRHRHLAASGNPIPGTRDAVSLASLSIIILHLLGWSSP